MTLQTLDNLDPADALVIRRASRARAELAKLRREHPLAFALLWEPECRTCPHPNPEILRAAKWHRGMPLDRIAGTLHECPSCGERTHRTNQRAAVADFLSSPVVRIALMLGGNRTGKTEAGAMVDVAFALGAEHPAVRAWARVNRLDPVRIQPAPGRVWASSLTFNDAREYLRPKLEKYLPGSSKYRGWGAENEAEVHLPGGGAIVSKAVRQGRTAYQGGAIHLKHFDEEPTDKEVVTEADWRLLDHRATMLITATPLLGWTPFLTAHMGWYRDGKPCPTGTVYAFLHGVDNPHIDRAEVEAKAAKYPEAIRKARLRGEITALEGAVHPEWSRDVFVVPAFDPPEHWPRFGGIDFGTRVPFAHLWFALDESADTLHVYREHYVAEMITKGHADAIHRAEACPDCYTAAEVGSPRWWDWMITARSGQSCGPDGRLCEACGGTGRSEPEPLYRWADPEGLDSRMTLNSEYGIATVPAQKDRRDSFDSLWDRMAFDAEGRPGIVFHDCCVETIRECENLTWDDKRKAELETKGDDHAHDVVRYVCHGLRRSGYGRQEYEEAAK